VWVIGARADGRRSGARHIAVAMPMLRRLSVTAYRDETVERPSDVIRAVARALGAQLELLVPVVYVLKCAEDPTSPDTQLDC
jgi:hypothetical protein